MAKTHPVPRLFPGETVVCIASGPSLTREDVEAVRGKARVIVVNNSYQLAPWADVLYGCDARWWKWHNGAPEFHGMKFALTGDAAKWPGVKVLGRGSSQGLSLDPAKVCLGGNSGYQAINVAVLMGAVRIVLLGYDMKVGERGKQHWHADHPMKMRSPYTTFQRAYQTMVKPLTQAGVEVVNCSRETALTCFARRSLADVFPQSAEAAA